jgi:ACT domain-containing protein
MMMVADINEAPKDFHIIADELAQIGDEIGVDIRAQKAAIFDKMHRI